MKAPLGHLLVVDDDADLLQSYLQLLVSSGYTADGASDGAEAILRLMSGTYDAVLSDVHMPRWGGLDVLSGIRTRDLDVPVILMSGDPTLFSAMAAVEEGAVAYLTKPLRRSRLIPMVEKAVGLGQLARAKRASLRLAGVDGHLVGDRVGLRVCFDRAIESLFAAYQPIVEWSSRTVVGYEALLRTGEPVFPNPGAVLAAAERLDRLFEVGRAMRAVVAAGAASVPVGSQIFVNLHPTDLLDEALYDSGAPLSEHASRTVLEITERGTLDHITDVAGRMNRLRKLGFRIAIDDLGAGYAGLNSLVQLQPDVVKLDMVLIRNVHLDANRQGVVAALIALSERLNMRVICEGVETVEEREFLTSVGGNWLQGYHFARPGPAVPGVNWG